MDSLKVENLKSIRDSGHMSIRPITIFVGRNSSGKSSIVRTFPLFKQSGESKTLGSVLWSGKYVDYGSFDESINLAAYHDNSEAEIAFTYNFTFGQSMIRGQLLPPGTSVELKIKVKGNEYSTDSYTRVEYTVFGNFVSLQYDSAFNLMSASLNNVDFSRQVAEHYFPIKGYSLTPSLYQRVRAANKDIITAALAKELKRHAHHRTSQETLDRAARALRFGSDEAIKKSLSNRTLLGDVAAGKMANLAVDSADFVKIRNQLLFCDLGKIVDQITDSLQSYFEALRYITPLRAAADRYYRIQNTSIEELDPNGSNLAMFLHAQGDSKIDEINSWLESEIGFTIQMEKTQGHASILIVDEYGHQSNIADTGFGFSQILPILIQMWQSSKNADRRFRRVVTPDTVVIEQPELHLHPRMQSQVGRMFCKAVEQARVGKTDLRVIIETHSRDIVEAVGRCVEDGTIRKEDVAIYIVDKEAPVCVSASLFDDGGYLIDWPYGFFDGGY